MAADDRGFASMNKTEREHIEGMGSQAQGKENNPGNFANDKSKAIKAGKRGGENSHGGNS